MRYLVHLNDHISSRLGIPIAERKSLHIRETRVNFMNSCDFRHICNTPKSVYFNKYEDCTELPVTNRLDVDTMEIEVFNFKMTFDFAYCYKCNTLFIGRRDELIDK